MNYIYYPGCSVTGANRAYDLSTRAVARQLDIGLHELADWNCCGATAYFSVWELRSFLICARNLALAEKHGKDLVTICNGCFTVLNKTNDYLREDQRLREKVRAGLREINLDYRLGVNVRHLLDVFVNDLGLEKIGPRVKVRLQGLKIAPYYGCQLSRPKGTFDDREFPMSLDNLLRALGAEVTDFPLKAKCCGGMLMSTAERIGLKLSADLMRCALDQGADLIATVCPLCHMNLEAYQGEIGRLLGKKISLPVLYFTQVLGLALGVPEKELGLDEALVSARKILERIGS